MMTMLSSSAFMSCWVAPILAAEIWGISVEQVMARVRDGEVATRNEGHFTFVDVAPDSPITVPMQSSAGDRPATFSPVAEEEIEALVATDVEPETAPQDAEDDT